MSWDTLLDGENRVGHLVYMNGVDELEGVLTSAFDRIASHAMFKVDDLTRGKTH